MLGPFYFRENYGHVEVNMDRHLMPHAGSSTDWNEALNIISFGSPEQVMFVILLLCIGLSS